MTTSNAAATPTDFEPAAATAHAAARVAVVFPGQGAQFIGMGQELCARHPAARAVFDEASQALGLDLPRLCWSGDPETLARTANAQPATLACSLAAYRVLEAELGLRPACGAGHSLGEWSALVAAGVLSLADGVRLVALRGRLMQEAAPLGFGGMAAIFGCGVQQIRDLCAQITATGHPVHAANVNASEQTVITGAKEGVRLACAALERAGAVAHELSVSVPAHSTFMASAAAGIDRALDGVALGAPAWPVLSAVTAAPYAGVAEIRALLVEQIVRPVDWLGVMRRIEGLAPELVIDVGPKAVLRDLFKAELPAVRSFAGGTRADVERLRGFLAARAGGAPAARPGWSRFFGRALAEAAATRNRCVDPARHAREVVEPHRKLRALAEEQELAAAAPGGGVEAESIRRAAELLRRILRTKKVPDAERRDRFARLIASTETAGLLPDFEP